LEKDNIHWGSSVPEGWNGDWPERFQTIPEKTEYKRTASNYQVIEYLTELAWSNENMHIERMFISDLRRIAPYVVLAEPRVTTPEEARARRLSSWLCGTYFSETNVIFLIT